MQHDGKETEASVEISYSDRSWFSLGHFYFSPGKVSGMLIDRGSIEDKIIFADAVKWVYDDNKTPKK